MSRFIDWFNRTAPGGSEPLPVLMRAGIAHLYFICVHPFEDGNGRIGRAIAEKALAQNLGHPTLTALAATILAKRNAYYAALEANNKHQEITPWLRWFAATAIVRDVFFSKREIDIAELIQRWSAFVWRPGLVR